MLPHHTRLSDAEFRRAAGEHGWNAQQGFYVHRNRRLIVAGSWLGLGFQKEEHAKLARISIEIPNAMDEQWQLDVRKATAHPPGPIRDTLRRIAQKTRARAIDVYRHRGKIIARDSSIGSEAVFVWTREQKANRIRYRINRHHPAIAAILRADSNKAERAAALRLIEETIPIPLIAIDHAESPEQQPAAFDSVTAAEMGQMVRQARDQLRGQGMADDDDHSPPAQHGGLRPFSGNSRGGICARRARVTLNRSLIGSALSLLSDTPTPEEIESLRRARLSTWKILHPDDHTTLEELGWELETRCMVWVPTGQILDDPRGHEEWLQTAKAGVRWPFWERYEAFLERRMNWPRGVVRRLDEVTDEILSRLEDPRRAGAWDRRGLVVGRVQSGKTSTYIGLIAKASDAGYRLIIVLAGLHNSLRSQTQVRLDEGFLGFDTQRRLRTNGLTIRMGVGELPGFPAAQRPPTHE